LLDNPDEAAVLGLQYLRDLSDVLRARAAGHDHIRPLLMAGLSAHAKVIEDKLVTSGIAVVEVTSTRKVVSKKVYLTTDPEQVREGAIPIDAIAFDIAPVDETTKGIDVFNADRAKELLFSTQRVTDDNAPRDGTGGAAPVMATLSPFMRGLLNLNTQEVGLTGIDLGLNDHDDDDVGGPRLVG
jgi:hypothetical protein